MKILNFVDFELNKVINLSYMVNLAHYSIYLREVEFFMIFKDIYSLFLIFN